jgi:hypothetical protein
MGRTLAANYSPQLLDLLLSYPGIVDAVKVSEFYDATYLHMYRELAAQKPLVMHGVAQQASSRRQPSPGGPGFAESSTSSFFGTRSIHAAHLTFPSTLRIIPKDTWIQMFSWTASCQM